MIDLARRRVPDGAAVVFHQIGIADFEPARSYDLVVSHFFLDCFEREGIRSISDSVSGCLEAGGTWLISDFQMPEKGFFRRFRARLLLWLMYRFFAITAGLKTRSLVDPSPVLDEFGFALDRRDVSNFGFLRADRWILGCRGTEN